MAQGWIEGLKNILQCILVTVFEPHKYVLLVEFFHAKDSHGGLVQEYKCMKNVNEATGWVWQKLECLQLKEPGLDRLTVRSKNYGIDYRILK